jgi:uncharacterized protein YecT (DUF1311 family)
MSKFQLTVAALIALAPAGLMAAQQLVYEGFALSQAQMDEVTRAADAQCPQKSDDYSSTLVKEPLYQTACRAKLVARSEANFKAVYKRMMANRPEEFNPILRATKRAWMKTRYDDCARDRADNLGGARREVLFQDCKLFEIKRFMLWTELSE